MAGRSYSSMSVFSSKDRNTGIIQNLTADTYLGPVVFVQQTQNPNPVFYTAIRLRVLELQFLVESTLSGVIYSLNDSRKLKPLVVMTCNFVLE